MNRGKLSELTVRTQSSTLYCLFCQTPYSASFICNGVTPAPQISLPLQTHIVSSTEHVFSEMQQACQNYQVLKLDINSSISCQI